MGRRVNVLDPELLKTALLVFAVVSVIGIGLAILERIRRVMIKPEEDAPDLLATLEEAYEAGDLDEAELNRVRDVLEKKTQNEWDGHEPRIPKF